MIRTPLHSGKDAKKVDAKMLVLVCALTTFLGAYHNSYAELILTAPPRETAEIGEKTYGPLAEYLSQLLGEKVTYRHPYSWLEYQRDVRKDVYDIVFDGPHFVSWRMEHLKHDVLVKLPGTLEFVIVANSDDSEIAGMNDLVGKYVCTFPPPNLAALIIIQQYPNPVRQPELWGVAGSFNDVYAALSAKKCSAAVFRSNFYFGSLKPEERAGLKVLFSSKPLPNQAISVSKRVGTEEKLKIIQSLGLEEGRRALENITARFSGSKTFITAKKNEYVSHNLLLEGVVFGW